MPATRDLLDWHRAYLDETSPLQLGLLARQTQNVSGLFRYCCRLAGGLAVGRNGRGRRGGKPTFTPVSRRSGGSSDLESGGRCGAQGHLLLDLEQYTLSRTLPLALLPPDAPVLVPSPLPDTLPPESETTRVAAIERQASTLIPGPTFDASTLPEPQRAQFHRNLRAVEQVLAGATQSSVAEKEGIPRSTLSRLVSRTRKRGQIACVPHGSYQRASQLHPAFAECIRRLFGLPTPTGCATSFTSTAIRFESILHRFSFS